MTTTNQRETPATSTGGGTDQISRNWRARFAAVALAVIATFAVWIVAGPIIGLDLVVSFDGGATQSVGPGAVIVVSLIASLLGAASLAVLERTRSGRAIWTVLAVLTVLLSLAGPLSAQSVDSTRLALVLMHLTVGAVLIPSLVRTSPTRTNESA